LKKIGITTTIPVEAVFAADCIPVDLNNLFISHPERDELLESAEAEGLPSNTCSWIKGIYAAAKKSGVDAVVGVLSGDCSNTKALLEIWKYEGVETLPFAYPHSRDEKELSRAIDGLCASLGTTRARAEAQKKRLDEIRMKLMEIDELTWKEQKVSGAENHLWLVSSSDFQTDPAEFDRKADAFLTEARTRTSSEHSIRLGYIGVPPILDNLYDFLESLGAGVVFNETQRQFSLPFIGSPLVEAYGRYTYPYDVFGRISDIKEQAEKRKITGLIHYVQSFCFRQLEDFVLRKMLDLPILTLEGDRPGKIDGRTRTRIESFVEMLSFR